MNHFYIFALIINLIAGSYIFLFIHQIYKKTKANYLSSLRFFTIFFNFLILAYFASKYISTNVLIDSSSISKIIINSSILFLFFISEFSVGFFMYKTVCFLKGEPISKKLKRIYVFFGILFFILYAYHYLIIFSDSYNKHLLDMVWELSINIFIIIQLISLIYFSHTKKRQNSMRSFGYIFFIGFLCYLFPHISYYIFGKGIGKYTDPIVLLFINIAPWIWLRFFYLKQKINLSDRIEIGQLYEKLRSEFSISKREFEVINQIILGKSNQEMCDTLFISFHTVKNHIYSIFKKLEINSRSQLIHYINHELYK